ncbi:MAG: RagB/SusD family nutrient uptake outer membrane protein [Tannerella sp.]|jgi:tetratricopeptide (TPR) repeat protein|nr:RagB/SusD family nutrient uptake outer membrane protein [Tannerella sp.]
MKKTIFLAIYTVAAFMLTTGCGDELLDKAPYGAMSEATFYQTETDLIGAVNAAYGPFFGRWGGGIYDNLVIFSMGVWSDDFEKGGGGPTDQGALEEMNNYQVISTNSMALAAWNNAYSGVFRANKAIEQIEESSVASKDRLLGEAKFLRAIYYYNLVIRYNGVPLITSTATAELKNVSRSSAQEVWAFIEQDLKDACNGLPVSFTGADQGRPTKGSAQGLLGRVYLSTREWQKAADVYAEIINSGRYSLMEDYGSLFVNQGSDHLPESLFEIESTSGKSSSFVGLSNGFTPRDVNGWGGVGFCVPTQSLVDEFEPGDLRRAETIVMEGDMLFGLPYDPAWSPYTGYNTKKYMYGPEIPTSETDANYKVIRYAEILLSYAEAIQNGAAEKANITGLQALNAVRQRAGLQAIAALSFEAIVHERRVELAVEGLRFPDLVRWGIAKEVLGANFDVNRDEYLPIPFSEILINPNLQQNPGY